MKTIQAKTRCHSAARILAITSLSAAVILAGCQERGTAEKAGQKIDNAAENASQKFGEITGKAGKQIETAKDAAAEKTQSAEEYVDDSMITTKVKSAILNDAALRSSLIDVTTSGGVVQLSGTAKSQQVVEQAVAMAKGQKGVKAVNSSLTVNAHASGNP